MIIANFSHSFGFSAAINRSISLIVIDLDWNLLWHAEIFTLSDAKDSLRSKCIWFLGAFTQLDGRFGEYHSNKAAYCSVRAHISLICTTSKVGKIGNESATIEIRSNCVVDLTVAINRRCNIVFIIIIILAAHMSHEHINRAENHVAHACNERIDRYEPMNGGRGV